MDNKKAIINKLHKEVPAFARKVAPVYKALGWTWHGSCDNVVPDAVDIALSLTKMIDNLAKSGYRYVSTGGLAVRIEEDPETGDCLIGRIEFQLYEEVYEDEV